LISVKGISEFVVLVFNTAVLRCLRWLMKGEIGLFSFQKSCRIQTIWKAIAVLICLIRPCFPLYFVTLVPAAIRFRRLV